MTNTVISYAHDSSWTILLLLHRYIRCCKWQETTLVAKISHMFHWRIMVVEEVQGVWQTPQAMLCA